MHTKSSSDRRRFVLLLAGLALFNLAVWLALARLALTVDVSVAGMGTLAYFLGLRHGFDADHIAAIDNVTRKLRRDGRHCITTGLFFALGHSTIVIMLALGIALESTTPKGAALIRTLHHTLLGTMLSSAFLTGIGIVNLIVFIQLYRTFTAQTRTPRGGESIEVEYLLERRGVIARIFGSLYRRIDAGWKMYFVGFLFGLGFDTATEVGLLAIAAEAAGSGHFPFSAVMIFPLLFAAGMTVVDALDGALMMRIYEWAAADSLKKLFFNTVVTGFTVAMALLVAVIEWLQALSAGLALDGPLWRMVDALDLGMIGLAMAVLMVVLWFVAWLQYRRRFSRIGNA
ncbi:MAG: HoxN/HupN/NixA family nickel/cobalt transporter [Candidatus Binataceae bacterium]|nr:HoxN/HupN/NixA family nickel/cobalt transporter [Candidatus Binataceae bacterium]